MEWYKNSNIWQCHSSLPQADASHLYQPMLIEHICAGLRIVGLMQRTEPLARPSLSGPCRPSLVSIGPFLGWEKAGGRAEWGGGRAFSQVGLLVKQEGLGSKYSIPGPCSSNLGCSRTLGLAPAEQQVQIRGAPLA